MREAHGSLDAFLWGLVPAPPPRRTPSSGPVPAETAESRALSKELKRQGFRFVGPTVCYAFMQAVGMVDDHAVDVLPLRRIAARSPWLYWTRGCRR